MKTYRKYDVMVKRASGGEEHTPILAEDGVAACRSLRGFLLPDPVDPVVGMVAKDAGVNARDCHPRDDFWLGMLLTYCLEPAVWRITWGWEAPVRKPVKQLRRGQCGYNGGPAPEWSEPEEKGPKEWETLFRPAPYQRLKLAEV